MILTQKIGNEEYFRSDKEYQEILLIKVTVKMKVVWVNRVINMENYVDAAARNYAKDGGKSIKRQKRKQLI